MEQLSLNINAPDEPALTREADGKSPLSPPFLARLEKLARRLRRSRSANSTATIPCYDLQTEGAATRLPISDAMRQHRLWGFEAAQALRITSRQFRVLLEIQSSLSARELLTIIPHLEAYAAEYPRGLIHEVIPEHEYMPLSHTLMPSVQLRLYVESIFSREKHLSGGIRAYARS